MMFPEKSVAESWPQVQFGKYWLPSLWIIWVKTMNIQLCGPEALDGVLRVFHVHPCIFLYMPNLQISACLKHTVGLYHLWNTILPSQPGCDKFPSVFCFIHHLCYNVQTETLLKTLRTSLDLDRMSLFILLIHKKTNELSSNSLDLENSNDQPEEALFWCIVLNTSHTSDFCLLEQTGVCVCLHTHAHTRTHTHTHVHTHTHTHRCTFNIWPLI
jgi:hypothetical protein